MEGLYEFLLGIGNYLYAEGAVFEALCLCGVLFFSLLSIRTSRKTKIAFEKANENFAKAAIIRESLK